MSLPTLSESPWWDIGIDASDNFIILCYRDAGNIQIHGEIEMQCKCWNWLQNVFKIALFRNFKKKYLLKEKMFMLVYAYEK